MADQPLHVPALWALLIVVALLPGCTEDQTAATQGAVTSAATADIVSCAFDGGTDRIDVEGADGRFRLTGVDHQVIDPGCVERVAFTIDPSSSVTDVGYSVFYRDTPFRGPSGELIDVAGEVVLEVVIAGAARDAELSANPAPAEGAELVMGIVQPPEVPGGSIWLLGLAERVPFTARLQQDPQLQLVVSIGTPGE